MNEKPVHEADQLRLADFPEQNPNPIFRLSFRGDLLYANASAKAFLADLSQGGDAPAPAVLRSLAAKAEETPVVEGELADANRRTYWYTAVRPAGENYVNFYLRDITLRKRAEEALRESEARFRALTEASPAQIAVSRVTDGTILYANRAYERAFGFEAGGVLGRTAPDLYVDPADRNAIIAELQKDGVLLNREIRVKRKDGQPFWILASGVPIAFDGKDAILGASIDISDRKRAEAERERIAEQRQLALDAARMGWWHYDPVTTAVSWDDRFKEIFGVMGRDAHDRRGFRRVHPPRRRRLSQGQGRSGLESPRSPAVRGGVPHHSARWRDTLDRGPRHRLLRRRGREPPGDEFRRDRHGHHRAQERPGSPAPEPPGPGPRRGGRPDRLVAARHAPRRPDVVRRESSHLRDPEGHPADL